jgi:hypothetical protein
MFSSNRRRLLQGGAALLGCRALPADAQWLPLVGNSTPVLLPSTTIADFAIKGSASAYIDIGTMGLPSGDWCIGVTAAVPAISNTDFFLLSLGSQSDAILTNSGSLTIGWSGAAGSPDFSNGFAAVGYDDAAVGLSPRVGTFFASSTQNGVSGPQQNAGTPDALSRTFFVQKQSGVVSFWWVDTNCAAIQYNQETTAFGAISAKAARLGCLGKAALSGFSAITYQRFFKTAQALTQYQMEAITSGVDPRAVVNFSAANGDLLFAFNVAAADLQTYSDLIQGQTATAHGTFAAATALLPATVDQNQIRFDIDRYRGFQSNGAVTNLFLTGNAYGADGIIQVEVTDQNGVPQFGFLPIGGTLNGKFSGTYPGVTTGVGNHNVVGKKLVNGVQVGSTYQTANSRFVTGPILEWLGQSLAEQMRTNNNYNVTSGALAFNARNQATLYDNTMRDHYAVGCSQQTGPGYGEGRLTQIVGNALNYQFMQMNDALSGSSLAQWLSDTVGYNSTSPLGVLTNALTNIKRFRPKYIIWHQGENSLGLSYATYYSQLTSLYAALSAAINWPWYFLIIPVDNNFSTTTNYDVNMQAIRSAQIDWSNTMHATDSKVVLACTVNDILKANTNADGIHKVANPGGYGIYSERVAQTLLYLEGNQSNSGLGPTIASAAWTGAATFVDVALVQNGGTGLQTNGGGAPTGFQASIDGFATQLTISSAAITDATHVRLTLSATPASAPAIRYQWGCPGLGTTDIACGINNALYDNRTPAINTTLGFPVVPTTTAIQSV